MITSDSAGTDLNWTAFESRWLAALLAAMIPAGASGRPGLENISLDSFWSHYATAAPSLLRFGLRSTVWFLTFCPIVYVGRACTFGGLDAVDRDRLLERTARSNFYLVRQMAEAFKLVACLAYFHDDGVRASVRSPRSGVGVIAVATHDEMIQ